MTSTSGHNPAPAVAVAMMVATAVPGLFGFFCPGILDAGQHPTPAVRRQQGKAAVSSLVLGAAGSAATKTPWPFVIAILLVGLIMWEYRATPTRQQE